MEVKNISSVQFRAVVLKLGSAALLGSARQFSGVREAPSKNQHDAPEKKILCKIKFSGMRFTIWQLRCPKRNQTKPNC